MKVLICFKDEEIFKEWRKIIEGLGYESYSRRIEELITHDLITLQLTKNLIEKERKVKRDE